MATRARGAGAEDPSPRARGGSRPAREPRRAGPHRRARGAAPRCRGPQTRRPGRDRQGRHPGVHAWSGVAAQRLVEARRRWGPARATEARAPRSRRARWRPSGLAKRQRVRQLRGQPPAAHHPGLPGCAAGPAAAPHRVRGVAARGPTRGHHRRRPARPRPTPRPRSSGRCSAGFVESSPIWSPRRRPERPGWSEAAGGVAHRNGADTRSAGRQARRPAGGQGAQQRRTRTRGCATPATDDDDHHDRAQGRPAGRPDHNDLAPPVPPQRAITTGPSGALYVTYRVFATQYAPLTPGSVEVAIPDKCVKWAALGMATTLKKYGCSAGYAIGLDYRCWCAGTRPAGLPAGEGRRPVEHRRQLLELRRGVPSARRLFTTLEQGKPMSQAGFYNSFNTVPDCQNLDGTQSGHPGPADQFGRCVLNPAGIDLSPAAAAQLARPG